MNSFGIPTPVRQQLLRQRLLSDLDDFDEKIAKKCSTPKHLSPIYSPKEFHKEESHFTHLHQIHSHPCDLFYRNCYKFDNFHEPKSPNRCPIVDQNPSPILKSPKVRMDLKHEDIENKLAITPTKADVKRKLRRAKSVPRDMFSSSNYFPSEHSPDMDCVDRSYLRSSYHDNIDNMCPLQKLSPSTSSPQPLSTEKPIPKIKIHKPKSKTPNSMDAFLSSKLVRGNLAANLRQKYSRKKLRELADEQLKATLRIEKFIPKCHQWNVRDTRAWKTFTSEE